MARNRKLRGKWQIGCIDKNGRYAYCSTCTMAGKPHRCNAYRGPANAFRFENRKLTTSICEPDRFVDIGTGYDLNTHKYTFAGPDDPRRGLKHAATR